MERKSGQESKITGFSTALGVFAPYAATTAQCVLVALSTHLLLKAKSIGFLTTRQSEAKNECALGFPLRLHLLSFSTLSSFLAVWWDVSSVYEVVRTPAIHSS